MRGTLFARMVCEMPSFVFTKGAVLNVFLVILHHCSSSELTFVCTSGACLIKS